MKIAILYITLGRYDVFFKGFYESAHKKLFLGHEKHFFIFTDSLKINSMKNSDITVIKQEKMGWPFDTLMRFKMFESIEDKLKNFDYIFFFNSNIVFIRPVKEEIFPGTENGGIAASIFYMKNQDEYTYDRNPESNAYIPYGKGKAYYQGGLNGGTAADYLQMIKTVRKWVDEDVEKKIFAKWNDESYINKYLLDKNPLIINRNYMFPQEWRMKDCPGKLIAMLRDKSNPFYGGTKWLRGDTNVKDSLFKALLKKPFWFLKILIKYFM
ncbi:MAG: glycosyl transferase family 6 [Candidatus Goldbacteria bacterium]|nr:glycosyl transferase family 6 [Candidatus Goldiibacteriota bacterium]